MLNTPVEKKAQLIERISSALSQRLAENAAPAVAFARQYYARAAPEDLLAEDPEDLYGAVLSHWNFSRRRRPGATDIRVFNPSYDEYGWRSTHTVVEIVNDDMPFLVDSVTMELNRHGLAVHRIFHPVLRVQRDSSGQLLDIVPNEAADGLHESFMHVEVDQRTDPAFLERLRQNLGRVLNDVRIAVADWQAMRRQMQAVVAELDPQRLPQSAEEVADCRAFLDWIAENHFTLLGYRNYDLVEQNGEVVLSTVPHSGLGILRDGGEAHVSQSFAELPPRLRQLALAPNLLVISKASARSTVHRPVHLDYLGIKRFDDNGRVIGEHRFLGLHTSLAYSLNPREIPLLSSKIRRVMARADLSPRGHAGKALANILDTFPRDDLFQATEDELYEMALGILHLQERQRLRLFVRRDAFERFVSCLIYVPRERYNTQLRERMEKILLTAFNGLSSTFTTQFSESVLARVQLHIRTHPGAIPDYAIADLEAQLREAMLSWEDHLYRALLESNGEELGNVLFRRYSAAFPVGYKEDFSARSAVRDIARLEMVGPGQAPVMHLYRPPEETSGLLRFKLYGPEQPTALSGVLPMLERLGLKVLAARPYEIVTEDGKTLWIIDFDLLQDLGAEIEVAKVKAIFQEAFARVWTGAMESDRFNRLVLGGLLPWRDVVVLRAYCKYLLQTRVPFSQAYMQRTLINHPFITRLLTELFHARFDPELTEERAAKTDKLAASIESALDKVASLDEDRILRRFLAVILATLRTNFFQTDAAGQPKEYLSFKFDPAKIPELPLPRPMFEIFVYSPRVEAVHLRGGPVARGGLRWSDRLEDFRTEVLGLVKAQMVKNAVIVPVGSKGGFVVKRPPAEREALNQEVRACYTTFISGMLDITDNRVDERIVPPPQVLRYDGDDPYLVVAADKGTATFSDLANSIAIQYGFWLGDAFASGGSAGYDHKKMGITARGAWESVKRHFRELGLDTQTEEFTVVGIGDMAGDVFGNGMLLSRHIRLLAAFNHLHIFLDPDPDPAVSFRERERLFNLPRSAWTDYNAELISKGGGIFPRTAKSIPISPEVRVALDIQAEHLTPNELLNAILKAPVDLFWNGGIGTYVKARTETHTEVGDRANDAVRLNGAELRCRVVGEGGNLGFTQLGRIEYALAGGHVLTDAIDNSGGVNSSDHEVNIKILLNQAVRSGDMTEKQRNVLLASMTDEVAELVLRQNYLQPQAISISHAQGVALLGAHTQVMRSLERAGKLDRALEFLPNDETLAEREAAGIGLVPPELSVLLAYSKINLFEQLIASDVPEDPYLQRELLMYFPQPLRERYVAQMNTHPLRREIIATYITNSMLNRMGSAFIFRTQEETGQTAPAVARAYTAAREMFEARRLWSAIEALDNQVPAGVQIDMHLYSRRLLERASLWLLRHRRPPFDIETIVRQFSSGIQTLTAAVPTLLQDPEAAELQRVRQMLVEQGVPDELALWVVSLEPLYSALDIIEVAGEYRLPVEFVGRIYFLLANRLALNWLRESMLKLATVNHWQQRARAALLNSLYDQARALTAAVLKTTPDDATPEQRLALWLETNQAGVARNRGMLEELRAAGQPDLAMLSVALRETNNLVQAV